MTIEKSAFLQFTLFVSLLSLAYGVHKKKTMAMLKNLEFGKKISYAIVFIRSVLIAASTILPIMVFFVLWETLFYEWQKYKWTCMIIATSVVVQLGCVVCLVWRGGKCFNVTRRNMFNIGLPGMIRDYLSPSFSMRSSGEKSAEG